MRIEYHKCCKHRVFPFMNSSNPLNIVKILGITKVAFIMVSFLHVQAHKILSWESFSPIVCYSFRCSQSLSSMKFRYIILNSRHDICGKIGITRNWWTYVTRALGSKVWKVFWNWLILYFCTHLIQYQGHSITLLKGVCFYQGYI